MIHIRAMTLADVPFGMRLKEQAGWNQLEVDWLRLLALEPVGCFVAELDGRPAGTLTTCLFGPVAWIAMVLVDSSLRKRGVGAAMMEHALSFLDKRGVRTIRLDATPLGQPIYEKLGFVTDYTLARYAGIPQLAGPSDEVRPARSEDLPAIVTVDQAVTGTDRKKLLDRLFTERPEEARVVERWGRVVAYLMARAGARAWQVGPCIGGIESARLLVEDACHRHAGQPVFLDIPLDLTPATELAEAVGLREQRRLTRMTRGVALNESVECLCCSSGPAKG